jgi:hypothetical protein
MQMNDLSKLIELNLIFMITIYGQINLFYYRYKNLVLKLFLIML